MNICTKEKCEWRCDTGTEDTAYCFMRSCPHMKMVPRLKRPIKVKWAGLVTTPSKVVNKYLYDESESGKTDDE